MVWLLGTIVRRKNLKILDMLLVQRFSTGLRDFFPIDDFFGFRVGVGVKVVFWVGVSTCQKDVVLLVLIGKMSFS